MMYKQFLEENQKKNCYISQEIQKGASGFDVPEKKKLSHEEKEKLEKSKKELDDLSEMVAETEENIKEAMTKTQQEKDEKVNDEEIKEAHPLFYGNVARECPPTSKVVRIFTSSTFTDTANERNILMEQAYPKIKSYCQNKGYEFQVVDMRWGVRDEATDDHMTTELCLRELKKCKEVSTGPYFVSLLSHKYGYRPLPREIDVDEFEKIISVTDTEEKRLLLQKWYLRDDNNVPPVYSLNSISKIFPDFVSNDRDKRKVAKDAWWNDHLIMHETLSTGAQKVLDPEAARKYRISVTETEIVKGIEENSDTENTCLWFKRTIQDIEKQEPSKQLSRYIECLGSSEDVKNARDHLHELRDNRLPTFIPQNRIWAYSVQWTNQGINQNVDEHRNYLTRLPGDFVTELCRMVDDGIRRRAASQINDPLYEECLQHMTFCKEKCKDFQGREKTLQQIKEYILGTSDQPFAIHGSSGCGKTSIMAMAAQKTWEWLGGKVGIVLRFVGTTPDSSDIMTFLPSITKHIRLLNCKTSINTIDKDYEEAFLQALEFTSVDLPIVVFIDSLDQFNPNNSARKLSWLPAELSENVKIIVSTLEDAKYECFPKLKTKIKPENFLNVPKLPDTEVSLIINHWLKRRNRTLTSQQLQCLMDAFNRCPLPLFLKLSFDEACRWTSRDTIDTDALQTTIHDSIHTLFARIEKIHGKLFVSRALGYMTLVKGGVSEAELEDILACDDEVLNDVYQYWTPPTRRLPPLLLVRLKSDLQQYLVERGIDGLRVMFWYHRQFIRAATERYCCDKELNIFLHKGLADFFSGTWSAGKKKPYTDKKGVESEADRYVAAQSLRFGKRTNVRKLMRLPYHLTCSLQLKRLKDECLCNFKFLLLKLTETTVSTVTEDFILAETTFPGDEQIKPICAAFNLSNPALTYDSLELPSQMLGRLGGVEILKDFLEQCRKSFVCYLSPNYEILTKPGGPLKYALAGHKSEVMGLTLKKDGVTAASGDQDSNILIWNIQTGRMINSLEVIGKQLCDIHYISNDTLLLVTTVTHFVAYREQGDEAYDIKIPDENMCFSFCTAGKDNDKFVVFVKNYALIYDAENGKQLQKVEHHESFTFDSMGYPYGTENFVAVSNDQHEDITVLSMKTNTFCGTKKAFPSSEYDTIDALAVTPDEKLIIYASSWGNKLRIIDLETFEDVRIIRGDYGEFPDKFHITDDGKYLYHPSHEVVVSYDLQTFENRKFFRHDAGLKDVQTRDFRTFVSITDESSVRVWDITAIKANSETNVTSQGFHPEEDIKEIQPLSNERYVFVVGHVSSNENRGTYFYIFDIVKESIVRKIKLLDPDCCYNNCEFLNDTYLALMIDRKLKILNLNTSTIEVVCHGKLPKSNASVVGINGGKEIVAQSRGRLFIKIYETGTGKTLNVMKADQSQRICTLKANSSTLLASTDDGPYLIFNLKTKECIHKINASDFGLDNFAYEGCVSPDGSVVAVMGNQTFRLPAVKEKPESTDVKVVGLWNVIEGKVIHKLHDQHAMLQYHSGVSKEDLSVSTDKMICLDNKYIVTSHDDYKLRVWDLKTGKQVRSLDGHYTNTDLYTSQDSKFFISNSSWTEEMALRVWSTDSLLPTCSYRFDTLIGKLEFLKTGKSFITTESRSPLIVYWQLMMCGQPIDKDLKSFPEIFPGKDLGFAMKVVDDNDELDDPNDLDDDVEEPEKTDFYDDDDNNNNDDDDDEDNEHNKEDKGKD